MESSVKLLSRFGLFLSRRETSNRRHVLKEHTSSLCLFTHKHSNGNSGQLSASVPSVKARSNPSRLVLHKRLPPFLLFKLCWCIFFLPDLLFCFGVCKCCRFPGCWLSPRSCFALALVWKCLIKLQLGVLKGAGYSRRSARFSSLLLVLWLIYALFMLRSAGHSEHGLPFLCLAWPWVRSLTYSHVWPKSTRFPCLLTQLKNPSAPSDWTRCVLQRIRVCLDGKSSFVLQVLNKVQIFRWKLTNIILL